MEHKVPAETVKELQIWLQGEFALVRQHQDTDRDELRKVRQTVHDLSNQVAPLIMANVPDRLAKHSAELDALRTDKIERKSAISTARLIGIIIGGVAGTIATLALEVWKIIHP